MVNEASEFFGVRLDGFFLVSWVRLLANSGLFFIIRPILWSIRVKKAINKEVLRNAAGML